MSQTISTALRPPTSITQLDDIHVDDRSSKAFQAQNQTNPVQESPIAFSGNNHGWPTSNDLDTQNPKSKKSLVQIATVMSSLCACVFLAALEVTIVSTALPTIAAHFASDSGYTWIGTSFVLAHCASTPSWGKISDIWGRKPILLVANVIFFMGSLVCALVNDLAIFIAGRAIQGLGAAGMQTLVNICISDMFSQRDRGLYYGLTSLIWAVASGIGPVLGGAFTDRLDWRWCFWINLPITAAVFVLLVFTLKLPSPNTPVWVGLKAIDWPGSFLVIGGSLMILLGLYLGGVYEPWNSATVVSLIVSGVVTAALFVWNEWKLAEYPVLPVHLFKTSSSSAAYAVNFFHAFVFMGVAYYLPLYFQAVLLASPLRSGVYLLPFILSISISAAITGAYIQFSGKYLLASRVGLMIMTLGMGLMINLDIDLNWAKLGPFQILTGIGVGMNFEGPLLSVQSVVPHKDVAAATTAMGFIRTMATAISVVVGGVLFQNEIKGQHQTLEDNLDPELARLFGGASASASVDLIKTLPAESQLVVRTAFFNALDKTWIMYTGFSGVGLLLGFFMKAYRLSKEHQEAHLGIADERREPNNAFEATLTDTHETHEMRRVTPKHRDASTAGEMNGPYAMNASDEGGGSSSRQDVLTEHEDDHDPTLPLLNSRNEVSAAGVVLPPQEDIIDDEAENKVLAKIDRTLIPLLFITYMFNFMDKVILSSAAVFGLREDTHLDGQQYSWIGSIFYVGYLLWTYPTTILVARLPTGKYLTVNTLFWGSVVTLTAACHNFGGLLVVRFLLGVGEATITPGFMFLTSTWYTRDEMPTRVGIWFSGNSVGGLVASLLAFAVGHLDRTSIRPWRWMYIILGTTTFLWAIPLFLLLPDTISEAFFLTPGERKIAAQRVASAGTGTTEHTHWRWSQVRECLIDPKSWFIVGIELFTQIPNGGSQSFANIVVESFGFTNLQSTLINIPYSLLSAAIISGSGYLAGRCRTLNCFLVVGVILPCVIGSAIIYKRSSVPHGFHLFAYFLLSSGSAAMPLNMALVQSNYRGVTKKMTITAMLFITYCVGNMAGPHFFRKSEDPLYETAFKAITICYSLAIGITGSNNIPLGKRRFGGDEEEFDGGAGVDRDLKRGRDPEPRGEADGPRRRKKRNRWGDASENKAAGLMGLPTAILSNMTSEQLEAYTLHLRIEEISQKLRIDDVVPADGDRSPSPAPQYDNHGRRINTREYRYRKRLEDERHKLIEKAMKTIPNYHPPQDYRRPTKTQEKVYVPVNDYPEINFIGLLIGPRGNTLKKMEGDSGAKIAIRGKGSVKEGKGRSDAAHASNQEEDLHCLIMADTEEKVNKAKKLIHNVIETAASIPEGQNELKRNQLRELAALNGTLRDDENQACQNCGKIGHRKYDCPEKQNYTASIICRVCGNAGHMARDCPDRQRGASWRNNDAGGRPAGRIGGGDDVDREYEQLMQELGGGSGAPARIEAGPGAQNNGDAKPWQRGPTGGPAPWRSRNQDSNEGGSAAPWARDRGGRSQDQQGGSGGDSYYGQAYADASGAAAPWQQQAPGTQGGYAGYPGYAAYGAAPGMGAPPGLGAPGSAPPPPPGAPPGLGDINAFIQQYAGTAPPPPPPSGEAPPPPPSDQPPPPPPPGA
ncbi:branchpoint-bridging [Fusarium beomiforme]|uniref:Branchpoint-bridging protein n=1 Tax=Fusarium beomiforme TaxID=44412 RepID=A0A9P5ASW3_9HYPO|nr:branchpoint-bridging [Fusarium beomiforme]